MRKQIVTTVLPLFIFFLLFACGPSNQVSVESFSPEGEVEKLTNFTVEFSEDLAPKEIQEKWLTDEFIHFEPKIQGKFKWVSGRTLVFSPEHALEPIQKYKASITSKVLFDKNLSLDEDPFFFNTPSFDAVKSDFFWSRVPGKNYQLTITANLHFNYPVVPDQLKKHLTIYLDDKQITDFEIATLQSSEIIGINLGEIAQTEKKQELKISVEKGLMSVIGKEALNDTRKFEYTLEPLSQLAITRVSSGFNGVQGWIEIGTTQKADPDKIKKYVTVSPGSNLKFFVNDNSFRIEGDFQNSRQVLLKVNKGMPGYYGGELAFDYERYVSLVDLDPEVNFSDKKGRYLMLGGENNLEVTAVNVDKLVIEVDQIFANNLVHFLNNEGYYSEDYYYDYNPSYYSGNFGKRIKTIKQELKSSQNWLQKASVNINSILNNGYKGIYIVRVSSADKRWVQDSKFIAVSDLGLIAKRSDDNMIVFVNSISEAKPVPGVKIKLLSRTNQEMFVGTSDENGVVRFSGVREVAKEFIPRIITAETSDDFNYIDLRETEIETSRFDVGGKTVYSQFYNAFIYSARNIYRPGEKVHLSAIVRDDMVGLVDQIPIVTKIISPNGKVFDEFKKTLNKEGSFELDFTLPDYAQTGSYIVELYTGGKELIGSYNISVEEFAPDKIRVNLKSEKENLSVGEIYKLNMEAEFLFGAKAANMKYEADVQLRQISFVSKKYPKFNFTNSSVQNTNIEKTLMEGTLDDQGKGNIKYIIPSDIKGKGILQGFAFVSVFDYTGRPVNRLASFNVFPNDYYLGIKSEGYYFGTKKNLTFEVVAVDKNDHGIKNFKAKAALYKLNWQSVLKKDRYGKYYYASEKVPKLEWEREITINETAKVNLNVTNSGNYELRIRKEGEEEYQYSQFYAYGWGASTASSFQVDKEGRIDVVLDKKSYEPGEIAKALFTTPFSGKLLVTVERNGVYDYQFVDVTDKSTEVDLPIKEEYLPNVYITATLFKAHKVRSDAPFLVGHGFANMSVEKKSNHLPVSIIAPKEIKPRTTQNITVKSVPEKDVYITLAVVDEGILQLKDYKTPDPYAFMYAKHPLGVKSYDLYKLLLPEIVAENSSPGGDALAGQLKKRTNPIKSKRFKLVTVWSGIKKTDSNGEVTVPIEIPQFNGEVRLMAVAYSGKRFGSSETSMKVRDNLIIEPEVPRFLTTGDSLLSNVTLINTTDKKGTAKITLNVSGPLQIIGDETQEVEIEAGSTENVLFAIKGTNVGLGKLSYSTTGLAKLKDEIELAVRPSSPFATVTGVGEISAGETLTLKLPSDYLKGTQKTSLTISSFPAVKFGKHMKYLVQYPYGCIEQTVSKLFPQIYFEDLAKLVAPELYKTRNAPYFVKEGIRKIESMQLYNGAMSYWQGGSYESWWGSVYAAHFLVEARKAGYNVSDKVLNNLFSYLTKRSREKDTYNYRIWGNGKVTSTQRARKEIIYSLYVLALAGKGELSTMNYYKSRPHLLTEDGKYLLAGAYALMGKMNSYSETIPQAFVAENPLRETGGSFDSEVRANAIMLSVLADVDPESDMVFYLTKHLAKIGDRIYSTQDRAFALMAMGKVAKRNADADVSVEVRDGKKEIGKYSGNDLVLSNGRLEVEDIELKASGKGKVYYFWAREGVRENWEPKPENLGMEVTREYYNYKTGNKITNNRFKQGELILCKIGLKGYSRSAENIVITDMIPAAFEIENARLSEENRININDNKKFVPQYEDIRDDRLILFTDLNSNQSKYYYYILRVVNKGDYKLPGISAEAMYDPEIRSVNESTIIKVTD